jgi:hypothetical protein
MALVPVVFIVEWLFSGMAIPLKAPLMRAIGYLTGANWGASAAASSAHLGRLAGYAWDERWTSGVGAWSIDVSMLVGLTLVALLAAGKGLSFKEPVPKRKGYRR